MAKTCVRCRVEFVPASNRQVYCTAACREPDRVCEACGSAFRPMSNTSGRWCSRSCYMSASTSIALAVRPCAVCATRFKPTQSNARYCGRTCAAVAHRKATKDCPVCGKQFNSRHRSRTCSYQCAGELRRREPDGVPCRRCGITIPWPASQRRVYCSLACRRTEIGTVKVRPDGYEYVYVGMDRAPHNGRGWMLHHRYVMEETIGRRLEPHESVHHINGRRGDNDPSNLELWKLRGRNQPGGVRSADYHCPGCRCADSG